MGCVGLGRTAGKQSSIVEKYLLLGSQCLQLDLLAASSHKNLVTRVDSCLIKYP